MQADFMDTKSLSQTIGIAAIVPPEALYQQNIL